MIGLADGSGEGVGVGAGPSEQPAASVTSAVGMFPRMDRLSDSLMRSAS